MELVQWTYCLCGDGHTFCSRIELSFLALQALSRTSYRFHFQKAVPSGGVSSVIWHDAPVRERRSFQHFASSLWPKSVSSACPHSLRLLAVPGGGRRWTFITCWIKFWTCCASEAVWPIVSSS